MISSLREWMAEVGKRSYIAVSWLGKLKTTAQMILLVGLLWRPNITIELVAIFFLYFAAILACYSMFQYLCRAWRYLNDAWIDKKKKLKTAQLTKN